MMRFALLAVMSAAFLAMPLLAQDDDGSGLGVPLTGSTQQQDEQYKRHHRIAFLGKLDLTDEQKATIKALREEIDAETVGYNAVVAWYLRQDMKKILFRGHSGKETKRKHFTAQQRQDLQDLKTAINLVHQKMREGFAMFHDGVMLVLSDEQKAKLEALIAEAKARRAENKDKRQERREEHKEHRDDSNRPCFRPHVSQNEAAKHGIFFKGKWDHRPVKGGSDD